MDELIQQMKVILGTTFHLYLKAHGFHWNVTGPDFAQYHGFLGDFYESVFEEVDPIAEQIRALDAYAPGSLGRMIDLSVLRDQENIIAAPMMIAELKKDNDTLLMELQKGYVLAEKANAIGLSNFLQDKFDAHTKHRWMLKSFAG